MLVTRLITAAIGIPLIAGVIWVGDGLLAAVAALAVLVATLEFASARGALRSPITVISALAAAALPGAAYAGEEYLLGAIVGVIVGLSAAFTLTRDPQRDLPGWLWGVAAPLYLGGLASYFVLLRESIDGRELVFFTVLAVWTTDTGAYFVGRTIGRHKLAPAISPGKTIEGSLGSFVTGFVAVFALDAILGLGFETEHLVALGLILPPVIMVGDLAESALKRALNIKDSSGLVPGHGGIADRLDSLLFAAPAVYYYVKWIVL